MKKYLNDILLFIALIAVIVVISCIDILVRYFR